MKKVFKYELSAPGLFTSVVGINLPSGAEVLSAAFQGEALFIWALVDPEASPEARLFSVLATGETVRGDLEGRLEFINTVFLDKFRYVFHVFEVT